MLELTSRQKELHMQEERIMDKNSRTLPVWYGEMILLCKDASLTDEQFYEAVRQKAEQAKHLLDQTSEMHKKKHARNHENFNFWHLAYHRMTNRYYWQKPSTLSEWQAESAYHYGYKLGTQDFASHNSVTDLIWKFTHEEKRIFWNGYKAGKKYTYGYLYDMPANREKLTAEERYQTRGQY